MIRVADYIIERLCEIGVKHIFMVTGRGVLYLSDAVAREEKIIGISMHHEQSAAYAAMAYSEYNEKMGACLVSTGCASTNAITGVLCAWQDSIPCVFISGQNMLKETTAYTGVMIRTYGQQEANIVDVVKNITKYATMITDANKIAYEIDKAFFLANEGRKGPVWIDVPLDIQNMRIEPEMLERYMGKFNKAKTGNLDIEYVAKELKHATRPVLLVGSGIRASGAIVKFRDFVEKYRIPVVYDSAAVDAYGAFNSLSMGVIGSPGGTRVGNFVIQNADLIISVGCRLSPMMTGTEYHKFAREAKLIVVDIDKVEHSKNTVKIDRFIYSDAEEFLDAIARTDIRVTNNEWIQKCLHWKDIFPKCEERFCKSEKIDIHFLADNLSDKLDDDAVLLCDAGIEELVVPAVVKFRKGQRCIHPASQGAMGFALPAAIGAYYASGKETVAVIGDGSIMMNIQELQTIAYNGIPLKIIITNNNCYSVIRKRQRELFKNRTIGTDSCNGLSCPDFKKVANAFDIPYMQINNSDRLSDELTKFLHIEGAILCEVMCVEEQDYICNGYARTKERRFVQRPIEDQAPFLNRDLFANEMVIEPIDL